jgi:hypothetical protein
MLTTIPFSGFYYSMHDAEFDREIENMVSDSSGCHPISQRIADDLWSHITTPTAQYAQRFMEDFALYFTGETGIKLKLTFDALDSPREYNFRTDRIFAHVSLATVRALYRACDKSILDAVIKERFTSYDGFISYYRPDRSSWGKLTEWDCNQVACLILALVREHCSDEWEWNIVEDWSGSGILSNWMYDGLDAEGKRLVKIADYLRSREERQYRRVA